MFGLKMRHINYDFDVEELDENIETYKDYRKEFYGEDETNVFIQEGKGVKVCLNGCRRYETAESGTQYIYWKREDI